MYAFHFTLTGTSISTPSIHYHTNMSICILFTKVKLMINKLTNELKSVRIRLCLNRKFKYLELTLPDDRGTAELCRLIIINTSVRTEATQHCSKCLSVLPRDGEISILVVSRLIDPNTGPVIGISMTCVHLKIYVS